MEKTLRSVFLSLAVLVFLAGSAEARHLKLYTYDLADVGTGVITYTFDRVSGPKEGNQAGNPTLHELELEYAFTKHWMQSIYVDYDYTASADGFSSVNEITAVKTEFNFTFFEKGEHFVDFRLNTELAKAVGNKIDAYGNTDAADTIEFRFIFEKNFKNFSIVLSPILMKDFSRPGELEGWTYGYANAILVDISDRVGVGLEFHGSMGEWDNLGHSKLQSHTIVPNFNIAITKDIAWSIGAGFPLTEATDDFTFRTAIAYSWEKFW